MKLQHVSIMFVLIFIPIMLVTSYFIDLQVKTIKLETSYNEKLINATYDAMTAFELNTANENMSSVSDSLRSIIDASNNIFFNTLCTNFGISNASKSYIQPYIPIILYTLYDGYYIYAPTNIPEICVDDHGRTIRTSDYGVSKISGSLERGIYEFDQTKVVYMTENPSEVASDEEQTSTRLKFDDIGEEYGQILYKNNDGTYSTKLKTISGDFDHSTYYKRDYVLKSYIPYSATYQNGDDIITINYTLDNFMTIEGNIRDVYYTKSGYFISDKLINKISLDGVEITDWRYYSEEKWNEFIFDPEHYNVKVELSDGTSISNIDGKVSISASDGTGTETRYWDDAQNAVKYYVDSYIFSKWVHENLKDFQAKNLIKSEYSVVDLKGISDKKEINNTQSKLLQDMLYDFSGDESKLFEQDSSIGIDDDNYNTYDPESGDSLFYKHKRNVIKNSITYNLLLSMLVYTEESKTTEFNMAVFNEAEWDRILNNVSITAFMEGMRCGLKYYNHYAIVTSTNNEISVTDNEIFYLPRAREDSENEGVYFLNELDKISDSIPIAHRIDCPDLVLNGSGAISFTSKEIKYDKILKKIQNENQNSYQYEYDHMAYTDYNCIVDSNYKVKSKNGQIDGNTDVLQYLLDNRTNSDGIEDEQIIQKLRAYRIAIAKERNNLYKTTAFPENYGWQVIYLGDNGVETSGINTVIGSSFLSNLSRKNINEIKKIEVTIEKAKQKTAGVYTSNIVVKYNSNDSLAYEAQTISTTSESRRTLEYEKDFSTSDEINSIVFSKKDKDDTDNTDFVIKAIKFYYK